MLAQIMKEVAEEARESSKRVHDEMFEKMRIEAQEELKQWVEQNNY
jgi:flagellar motor switch protein FliM